eukprot:363000-Chlamydomonas_euryale.AAC.1
MPTVARQSRSNSRSSPLGSRTTAWLACFTDTTADVCAERTALPPAPGAYSMLCSGVPTGMSRRRSMQPGCTGAPSPDWMTAPGATPCGATW